MVQKVFGICEAKNGTETDELVPEQVGTKDFGKSRSGFRSVRMAASRQMRQEPGGFKDKREESRERSIRGF